MMERNKHPNVKIYQLCPRRTYVRIYLQFTHFPSSLYNFIISIFHYHFGNSRESKLSQVGSNRFLIFGSWLASMQLTIVTIRNKNIVPKVSFIVTWNRKLIFRFTYYACTQYNVLPFEYIEFMFSHLVLIDRRHLWLSVVDKWVFAIGVMICSHYLDKIDMNVIETARKYSLKFSSNKMDLMWKWFRSSLNNTLWIYLQMNWFLFEHFRSNERSS